MCNQCSDLRAIHSGDLVYGVFHNGRFTMAYSKRSQAERVRELMVGDKCVQCSSDDCKWEVFEIQRTEITWDTPKTRPRAI